MEGNDLTSLWNEIRSYMEQNLIFPFIVDYIIPILEILFIAYIIYLLYQMLSQTRAIQVLKGVLIVIIILGIASLFGFKVIYWLLEHGIEFTALTFIILFQPELRNLLTKLGENRFFTRVQKKKRLALVDTICTAVKNLSDKRIGALIVFEQQVGLKQFIETGVMLEAHMSAELLHNIFMPKTPLHDGAVIIQGDRIAAASCLLPLTDRHDLEKIFGTRHRAAIGLSEESDSVILVVSEENGRISIAYDSKLYYGLEMAKFRLILQSLLSGDYRDKEKRINDIFKMKISTTTEAAG